MFGLISGAIAGIIITLLCSFAFVYPEDYAQAVKLCEGNGGIKVYLAEALRPDELRCVNGAAFNLRDQQ